MKNLHELDYARMIDFEQRVYGGNGDGGNGAFQFMSCVDGKRLAAIASDGEGWDHVSVSRNDRTPYYEEMEQIAALFFKENETAVQYHVPKEDHISIHKFCLHWWRPNKIELPRPPGFMVGPKT
jgi:hypothetical protein